MLRTSPRGGHVQHGKPHRSLFHGDPDVHLRNHDRPGGRHRPFRDCLGARQPDPEPIGVAFAHVRRPIEIEIEAGRDATQKASCDKRLSWIGVLLPWREHHNRHVPRSD